MKPILFSTDMVRANKDDRKTQTRRVINPQPIYDFCFEQDGEWFWTERDHDDDMMGWWPSYEKGLKPKYQPGDILWVRETFCPNYFDDHSPAYKADYYKERIGGEVPEPKWKPAIHMPRTVARIFLRVVAVRAERLADITDADAIAEGIYEVRPGGWFYTDPKTTKTPNCTLAHTAKQAFMWLWNTINSKRGFIWASNPWVWVYTLEHIDKDEAECYG